MNIQPNNMTLTKTAKIIIIISSIVIVTVAIVTPTTLYLMKNQDSTPSTDIKFTLLYNAGVMIEVDDVRIYIDPFDIPQSTYSSLLADVILITHSHGDHYQESTIDFLITDETLCVFPEIMTSAIATYDALGVVPGDSFLVGDINITCFYMYTFAPVGSTSSHPLTSNFTSYIINIDGFTFFHAGDSSNIPEYTQLNGLINVALLPLGPGCQTMTGIDVVNAIDTIRPAYFIPIHYSVGVDVGFVLDYSDAIGNLDCEIIHLAYFESHVFNGTNTE